MVKLTAIRDHVTYMLNNGLSKNLTYHNTHHTLDVAIHCSVIAIEEGITDAQTLFELQVAAYYHDTGFLYTYFMHEEKGCELARVQLPGFGLNKKEIENICELIMATKVPQTPNNHLQKIICDADLDYLGREDFFKTSYYLQQELISHNLITGQHDWEERQILFLQNHQYFTNASARKRGPLKKEYLQQLVKIKSAETK